MMGWLARAQSSLEANVSNALFAGYSPFAVRGHAPPPARDTPAFRVTTRGPPPSTDCPSPNFSAWCRIQFRHHLGRGRIARSEAEEVACAGLPPFTAENLPTYLAIASGAVATSLAAIVLARFLLIRYGFIARTEPGAADIPPPEMREAFLPP
jgi:hypothetical protein